MWDDHERELQIKQQRARLLAEAAPPTSERTSPLVRACRSFGDALIRLGRHLQGCAPYQTADTSPVLSQDGMQAK
jgi:hypothetical protein